MVSSPDPADLDAVRLQLGPAYERFSEAEQNRHLEMLQSIQRPEDVALDVRPITPRQWTVTVCASDCLGMLSTIAGLFAAYGFDISQGDIFTLNLPDSPATAPEVPRPRQPRRRPPLRKPAPVRPANRILDILEARAASDAGPDAWEQFRQELASLATILLQGNLEEARERLFERVSRAARAAEANGAQLFPVSVAMSNDASSSATKMQINSSDTPGFLFAFTTALGVLNANIQRAEIRTVNQEVRDTFWLTDLNGRKIDHPDRVHELRVAAALIKHFTYLLPRSPNPVQALRQFNGLTRQMLSRPDWTSGLRNLESKEVLATLAELMGVSQFLWEDFLRMQHENLFPVLVDMPALDQRQPIDSLRGSIKDRLSGLDKPSARVEALNRFKDREMFRIDLRHITRRIGFREFSGELSDLAEVVVGEVAALAHQAQAGRFGSPTLGTGRECQWCICALGKFGGRELGFASDIEMITVYKAEGATSGPTVIENSRYFGDFVRAFLDTLATRREGIFEVDLRLRPHGSSGPLASTLEGFRDYYSPGGGARQFERMALVKLRPVAGDTGLGAEVLRHRDAFVYSGEPLDLENILHLRHRQATELVPPGKVSAKQSPGGLVDLEYFIQACQIAAGYAHPEVRTTNTLDALEQLARFGYLHRSRVEELREAYGFLRRLIDALRVVRGHARDLTIPDPDSREFAYLARRLQFESPVQLEDTIAARMQYAGRVWDSGVPAAG